MLQFCLSIKNNAFNNSLLFDKAAQTIPGTKKTVKSGYQTFSG